VDFVVKAGRRLAAIEVKAGRAPQGPPWHGGLSRPHSSRSAACWWAGDGIDLGDSCLGRRCTGLPDDGAFAERPVCCPSNDTAIHAHHEEQTNRLRRTSATKPSSGRWPKRCAAAWTPRQEPETLLMITGAIKSQIDQIWNAFWSGGISTR